MNNKTDKWNSAEGAMKVLKIIGMVILGIAACFLFGLAVKLLWNWLMPMIFGLTKLTYWQGIGVLALSFLLFGRFGGGSSDDSKKDKGCRGQIKEEIEGEIKKELDKEFKKEKAREKNLDYDDVYDKWWESEGEKNFDKYMSSSKEDNDIKE